MRHFTTQERRDRLAVRHHLVGPSKRTEVADVARALVGLHGTDPASIFLSAAARMKRPTIESIEDALYEHRTVVRVLAMRRTLFVVPVDLVSMVQAAASDAVAANERKRLLQWIDAAGIASDSANWLQTVSDKTLAVVRELGSATTTEIAAHVPELRRKIVLAPNTKWGTEQSIGTRVVPLLGVEGRIARGRPRGSWISTQHRWEPIEHWLPGGLERIDTDEARAQLVSRWLRAFGPAPVSDLRWWTKWTLRATRQALGAVGAEEVDIAGVPGVALADDLEVSKPVEPWIALLPSLDPTVMGWQERTWFMGDHGRQLFDRAGNAGPTVWSDGRVVGAWAQRPDGDIVWRLFEDVGSGAKEAIAKEATRLHDWIGATRFTPRFGPRWTPE